MLGFERHLILLIAGYPKMYLKYTFNSLGPVFVQALIKPSSFNRFTSIKDFLDCLSVIIDFCALTPFFKEFKVFCK